MPRKLERRYSSVFDRLLQTMNRKSTHSPTLRLLRAGKVQDVCIELDPDEGMIRGAECFTSVLSLTVTFRNSPSLSDLASALSNFPNTRTLSLVLDPFALSTGPLPGVHGLSAILPKLQQLRVQGWNTDIFDWIANTSNGITVLEVSDLQGVRAAPRQSRILQQLLLNNETLRYLKLSMFYEVFVDLSSLYFLDTLRISVPLVHNGAKAAEAIVRTVPLGQRCSIKFIRLQLVDEYGSPQDASTAVAYPGLAIAEVV